MTQIFPVEKAFKDGQDNQRLYETDAYYPRRGLEPSEERIEELQEKGFIGGEGVSPEAPDTEEDEDSEEAEYPQHTGGGYYELSNGEKVQGKEEAVKAEEALQS